MSNTNDMRDYLDGNIPRTAEQKKSQEDTLAHAGMPTDAWKTRNIPEETDTQKLVKQLNSEKTFTEPMWGQMGEWKEFSKAEVMSSRTNESSLLKGQHLMSDFDVYTKIMKFSEEEANQMIARNKVQKLGDMKMQIMAQNPQLIGQDLAVNPDYYTKQEQLHGNPMSGDPDWTMAKAMQGPSYKIKNTSSNEARSTQYGSLSDAMESDSYSVKCSNNKLNLNDIAQEAHKRTKEMIRGILVIYVNVGALEPHKAEAFAERFKEGLNKDGFIDRMKKQGSEVMFIPNREGSSVEYIKL